MELWQKMQQRLSRKSEAQRTADVEQLSHLKESARVCRLECESERRLEEQSGGAPSVSSLASWKKRVAEAEGRYALAVHAWDNKQWRLKGQ